MSLVKVQAIGRVGTEVMVDGSRWYVYSVEGGDWYAFLEGADVVLARLTHISSLGVHPVATIIPVGRRIGEGRSVNLPLTRLLALQGHAITSSV